MYHSANDAERNIGAWSISIIPRSSEDWVWENRLSVHSLRYQVSIKRPVQQLFLRIEKEYESSTGFFLIPSLATRHAASLLCSLSQAGCAAVRNTCKENLVLELLEVFIVTLCVSIPLLLVHAVFFSLSLVYG